jgi:hypothetical protein
MAEWNKWIEVVDCIFVNKHKYSELTDDDKINSFFIINRKFAIKYPKIAQFLNDKSVDKSMAMDLWFDVFKNQKTIPKEFLNDNKHIDDKSSEQKGIPGWYWGTKSKKDTPKAKKDKDYEKIATRYGLKDEEMRFLIEFFKKDLDKDLKQIKMFEGEE